MNNDPSYENVSNELGKSPVIVIRCGNSVPANLTEKLYGQKGAANVIKEDWYNIQFSPAVIDIGLSDKGIKQCQQAAE